MLFLTLHQKKSTYMATVISQPGTLVLSSDIDDIVFSTSEEKGDLTVSLICDGTAHTVLEETLFADSNGRITVGDIASLVEPFAREYLRIVLNATFDDDDTAASIDPVTIIYCMADTGLTAQQFLGSHFLTVLDGEKMTAYGREERLYAYDSTTVSVSAEVRTATGVYQTRTATLNATSTENDISQFNVSVNDIISALNMIGGRLLFYTVSSGSRSQDFRVVEDLTQPDPSFAFVNSFGCVEFLHCVGTVKREGKYTRSSARFNRNLKNYQIKEERKFVANTGWLNDAMADWAEDILRSSEVFLWVNGQCGHEVVITESKSETNNEEDYMTMFEITYQYAQHIQNVMCKRKAARLFSEQFEEIYN